MALGAAAAAAADLLTAGGPMSRLDPVTTPQRSFRKGDSLQVLQKPIETKVSCSGAGAVRSGQGQNRRVVYFVSVYFFCCGETNKASFEVLKLNGLELLRLVEKYTKYSVCFGCFTYLTAVESLHQCLNASPRRAKFTAVLPPRVEIRGFAHYCCCCICRQCCVLSSISKKFLARTPCYTFRVSGIFTH